MPIAAVEDTVGKEAVAWRRGPLAMQPLVTHILSILQVMLLLQRPFNFLCMHLPNLPLKDKSSLEISRRTSGLVL